MRVESLNSHLLHQPPTIRMMKRPFLTLTMAKMRWPLMILALVSISTAMVFFMRTTFDSCSGNVNKRFVEENGIDSQIRSSQIERKDPNPNPLDFMKSKLVLLVSHELSLSGIIGILFS